MLQKLIHQSAVKFFPFGLKIVQLIIGLDDAVFLDFSLFGSVRHAGFAACVVLVSNRHPRHTLLVNAGFNSFSFLAGTMNAPTARSTEVRRRFHASNDI
jgi:hypothetical protein